MLLLLMPFALFLLQPLPNRQTCGVVLYSLPHAAVTLAGQPCWKFPPRHEFARCSCFCRAEAEIDQETSNKNKNLSYHQTPRP
jgi:hypothetical protein